MGGLSVIPPTRRRGALPLSPPPTRAARGGAGGRGLYVAVDDGEPQPLHERGVGVVRDRMEDEQAEGPEVQRVCDLIEREGVCEREDSCSSS